LAPALADVDSDGLDEIFVDEDDGQLHAYKADGTVLDGWPVPGLYFPYAFNHTPAIADLDGDGDPEIVVATYVAGTNAISLYAFHHDGVSVAGFPVACSGFMFSFPVIGDVDGDGYVEIVAASMLYDGRKWAASVEVYANTGVLKWSVPISGSLFYAAAPALADIDGDGMPEIIIQTETALNIIRGDGTIYPGWPVVWHEVAWPENSAPVVGDVDGDGRPEIVVTASVPNSSTTGIVHVFSRSGIPHPHFPKMLAIGLGAVPAIADIDNDGRNEIMITGNYWDGHSGYFDKVWVYDLGGPAHGPVLWGQFMGNAKHTGAYTAPAVPVPAPVYYTLTATVAGSGAVTSNYEKIYCGSECSSTMESGTSLILTATAADGNQFVGWGGACIGQQGTTCVVVVDGDKTVSAEFAPIRYQLTVSRIGNGDGTVSSTSGDIGCGTACMGIYDPGISVTLTAIAANGSTFTGWSGKCAGVGESCTVTMDADVVLTASFQKLAAGSGESGSAGGAKEKCFIATAAYGSYFDDHVAVLRGFRDAHLMTNAPGRAFVKFYYMHSPALAAYIAKREALRTVTRWALTPLVYLIRYPAVFSIALFFLAGAVGFLTRRARRCRASDGNTLNARRS
jgi:uncharacterized repeat protein (TIGR02543 family)